MKISIALDEYDTEKSKTNFIETFKKTEGGLKFAGTLIINNISYPVRFVGAFTENYKTSDIRTMSCEMEGGEQWKK